MCVCVCGWGGGGGGGGLRAGLKGQRKHDLQMHLEPPGNAIEGLVPVAAGWRQADLNHCADLCGAWLWAHVLLDQPDDLRRELGGLAGDQAVVVGP